MTKQDDLAAGHELDAQVAEKIMGAPMTRKRFAVPMIQAGPGEWGNPPDIPRRVFAPPYSTDISAAFQIVEHMDSLGWKVQIRSDSQLEGYEADGPWVCVFASRDGASWASADTVPLAICRAALKAVSD